MEKYYQLRESILNKLPESLLLSNFEYEERHFEKTNDFVSIFSIPVIVTIDNLQRVIDCGMSTSIMPKILSGEEVISKFCFAFRTFGDKTNFYLWSETEEDANPIRLPFFQWINVNVSRYGVKPTDDFPNVVSAIMGDEANKKENIIYYISSIVERTQLFSTEKQSSVNLKSFLLENFISNHSEPISLKVNHDKESSFILIEKYKNEKLFKKVLYDINNYSLGYVVKKLT